MLESLSIRNIVLVEKLDIDFGQGLCVLTGETGAGKSILLDALGLALGSRADLSLIRTKSHKGSVSVNFNIKKNDEVKKILDQNDIEISEVINLRRTLSIDGKSKAFCNDTSISVSLLKKIGNCLAEIQSQGSANDLFSNVIQLKLLDQYTNNPDLILDVKTKFNRQVTAYKSLQSLLNDLENIKKDEEYKQESLAELQTFNTYAGEEEKLNKDRILLKNLDKVKGITAELVEIFSGQDGINSKINKIDRIINRSFDDFGGKIDENILKQIEKFSIEGQEISYIFDNLKDNIDSNRYSVDEVEDRLFALRALARKHNCKCDQLVILQEELSRQNENKNLLENKIEELKNDFEKFSSEYFEAASKLSSERKNSARILELKITEELPNLKLENTVFKVIFSKKNKLDFNENGLDTLSFEVSTNQGEPIMPLVQVASGGELSRIMLALQVVLQRKSSGKVVIFDEVDSGVGGPTADAVGGKLSKLSKDFQILAITHSPQVAAKGQNHYKIEKNTQGESTFTNVKEIKFVERIDEIARMLSGKNITQEARAAAEILLQEKNK